MNLPAQAGFQTTHRFYLGAQHDLLQRARAVSAVAMNDDFRADFARAPFSNQSPRKATKHKTLTATDSKQYARQDSNLRPSV